MKHDHRLALLDHAMGTRHLQHRWRCEWCDLAVAPEEVLCEACARAELDREMEETER
jgi:hypothetical protein